MSRLAAVPLLATAALAAGGCVSLGFDRFFGGKLPVQVVVATDLNDASPVAVELLVIYDKGLLATLEQMTAAQWFAQRDQLLQTSRGKLDHWKWEWVPGQVVPDRHCKYRIGARGAVVFADYFSPGDHRASVSPFRPLLIDLAATDFTAENLD